MKAVVVERPHQVAYRDVETPVVGPGDVLVESRAAGLCRTDVEMMTGVFTDPHWVRFPVIPGHEWSGVVVEVGRDVGSVRPGDRVVCEGMIPCYACRRCKSGETHWCEPRSSSWRGNSARAMLPWRTAMVCRSKESWTSSWRRRARRRPLRSQRLSADREAVRCCSGSRARAER